MDGAVNHADREHSPVGPSAADRAIGCRGSAQMALRHGVEQPPGQAALEGTRAHEAMQVALVNGTDIDAGEDEYLQAADLFVREVRKEMALEPQDSVLLVEARVNLQRMHPDLFGTTDAAVWLPKARRLTIFDLKTGTHVVESDAAQVKLYAGMTLEHFGPRGDSILTIDTVVVQPRAQHKLGPVRRTRHSAAAIIDFANSYVEIVHEALGSNEDLPLKTGDWCWFCPARAACPAYKHDRLVATGFFSDGPAPLPLTAGNAIPIEELHRALNAVKGIEEWIEAVKAHALAAIKEGQTVTGWGVVPTRPTRRWADPQEAYSFLRGQGFTDDQLSSHTIITPAAAEKLVGKTKSGSLAQFITAESSGEKLARLGE